MRRLARWLVPRSRGVRVSRATRRLIDRGDAAMRERRWADAVLPYREAVLRTPRLDHIWVQLGHALKEQGDISGARTAYQAALAADPGGFEPLIWLGQIAKDAGERTSAARHYVDVLHRAPEQADAASELVRLLRDARADPALWREALAALGLVPAEGAAPTWQPGPGALLVDVGDLLGYLARARLPTGIQRVQIEVARAYAACSDPGITLCVYSPAARAWLALPADAFTQLCEASLVSDDARDPAWTALVRSLHMVLADVAPIQPATGQVVVNLGTSWGDRDYLADVRRDRQVHGMRYVAFVYDLIPMRHPEWFVPALVRDYRRWLEGVLVAADGYVVISEATRHDLLALAAERGAELAPKRVTVVRIDGDFRVDDDRLPPPSRLAERGLEAGGFVLIVSTVEPRKNHVGAFAAWLRLVVELGEARVPRLVCVGGKGWMNDPVHAMLAEHAVLRRKVTLLSGVADDELALLYRTCRFTLYPSFYEGWGLPVSESLGYGKVAAVSRTSSLPEAGGVHAIYFDPADPADIAAKLGPLILDDHALATAEAAVRQGYRARPWAAIARQIADAARGVRDDASAVSPSPMAGAG